MSVNWKCTDCAAYAEAKKYDGGSDEWKIFCNMRYALSIVLVAVRFPRDEHGEGAWAITEGNWEKVFLRVNMWEQMVGGLRIQWEETPTDEDKEFVTVMKDKLFTVDEIRSMIGFQVNAGTQSDDEYRDQLFMAMERNARDVLNAWKSKNN